MKMYTYSEARQNLSAVLDVAQKDGEVRIRRRDGRMFALRLVTTEGSPLDVEGIDIEITTEEIVDIVRESRGRFD